MCNNIVVNKRAGLNAFACGSGRACVQKFPIVRIELSSEEILNFDKEILSVNDSVSKQKQNRSKDNTNESIEES